MLKPGGGDAPIGGVKLVARGLQSCNQMGLSWCVLVLLIVGIDAGFLSFHLLSR